MALYGREAESALFRQINDREKQLGEIEKERRDFNRRLDSLLREEERIRTDIEDYRLAIQMLREARAKAESSP